MARLPRLCLPGIPQHIIQRGINKQVCFASNADFAAYARWLEECADKYQVAIHAWVFMTNHVHLLATPQTVQGVSRMMQALGRFYVRYFNKKYHRTGALWEGRFKSCVVDSEAYFLTCQRYIELNPVRAGIVNAPEEYMWSSYQANGQGKAINLWQPHDVYLGLAKSKHERLLVYRDLFKGCLSEEEHKQIREATKQGLVLGSDKFRREVEALTGQRARLLKRGPKTKERGK